MKILIICISLFLLFIFFYPLFFSNKKMTQNMKGNDNCIMVQSGNDIKEVNKNSEDWWYSVPHWYVMSNGEKFNISEYITWDLWNKLDTENRMKACINIENKILNNDVKENNKKELNKLY